MFSDDTALIARLQVAQVLLKIIGEQEHVAACGDAPGHGLAPGHHAGHADHVGGVGDDQAVEAQLAAQQIAQQLRGQGGRQDLLVSYARAQPAAHGGQGDLARHDGFQPLVDHRAVHPAVAFQPFLRARLVVGRGDMGVQLVPAVPGKVLAGAGHVGRGVLDAPDVRTYAFNDAVRVAAEVSPFTMVY